MVHDTKLQKDVVIGTFFSFIAFVHFEIVSFD